MARREDANYKNSRFSEPNVPKHFSFIEKNGLRKTISAYVNDDSFLYAFDPEHAMLALPIEAIKLSFEALRALPTPKLLPAEDSRFLASLFHDKSGPISEIIKMISNASQ